LERLKIIKERKASKILFGLLLIILTLALLSATIISQGVNSPSPTPTPTPSSTPTPTSSPTPTPTPTPTPKPIVREEAQNEEVLETQVSEVEEESSE